MRKLGIVVLCASLGGCAAAPKMLWLRADGQRASDNPVLRTQFELDGTACLGERSKANLSGVTVTDGGLAGIAAAAERSQAADSVQRGCMAEKGYLLVPEDQAEAKQAELAAVADLKRKQDGAPVATSSPVKPRKPAKPSAAPAT
ncbi:hypothetical protein [Bradyrhizobium lablabi]|uniref:hypothetical protein n=1 Tax=Bradyrhizobium lablabi TaxID=722472 RepID=UPI001BA77D62|nr:hypothetical protein [Bradyrhizobium lablabi]MBR0696743.1 hypothetical protein [Bradyrhizobium lablabi]